MADVFVTGATGFIGGAILDELLNVLGPDDRVMLLARRPVSFPDSRVQVLHGNLESLHDVSDVILKADFIIHIGGEARMLRGCDYNRYNVVPTEQLVNLAKQGAVLKRFIFISSIAVMDRVANDRCLSPMTAASPRNPRTEYGLSKSRAEDIIRGSGLPYTIFRPGFVYGRGMREASHLKRCAHLITKGIPLHHCGFPGKISLIHVKDLAIAVAGCLKSAVGVDRVYLAGTESVPLGEILSILGQSLLRAKQFQIPLPRLRPVFFKIHRLLPVPVAALFLDYLWMEDATFIAECLGGRKIRLFVDNVGDITGIVSAPVVSTDILSL